MLLTNSQRLASNSYSNDSPIIKESIISYFRFASLPQKTFVDVHHSELTYDDGLVIQLAGITESTESYFTLKESSSGPAILENFFMLNQLVI